MSKTPSNVESKGVLPSTTTHLIPNPASTSPGLTGRLSYMVLRASSSMTSPVCWGPIHASSSPGETKSR